MLKGQVLDFTQSESISELIRKAALIYKLNNLDISSNRVYYEIIRHNLSYNQALQVINNSLIKLSFHIIE